MTETQAKEYEFHPLADIFPLLDGDAFDAFVADIEARGLQEPIWLYEGKVLDGRNRYRACHQAGVDIRTNPYTDNDPVGFVVAANLHRRHLNETQRAMIAAKLVTTKLGDNQWRREGKPIDQPTAAKMLNVSPKSVQRAKEVLDKATPVIRELVEAGKVPVSIAAKVAAMPKKEQGKLKTASAIRAAIPPKKTTKTPEELREEWLKSLPVGDLIFWLEQFHRTDGYLRELSAALNKKHASVPPADAAVSPNRLPGVGTERRV